MESICDHAGCHTEAAWVSLARPVEGTEPHLCDLHWSVLSLRDEDTAGWYVPLSTTLPPARRAAA